MSYATVIYGGFTIANGVTIENATSGAGTDTLIGNNVANVLNGGGGADTMQGLGGNDVYIVRKAGDQAIEATAQGSDIVYALASYALTAGTEIERLSAIDWSSTNALTLTRNELANLVEGNAGAKNSSE